MNLSELIKKWKHNRDIAKSRRIRELLMSFWCGIRRKDLVTELVLQMDFSNEELVDLGDLLGYTAHMRERENIDLSKKG